MSKIKIENEKLNGAIKVPPSKSMAHRAIICASLANGISKVMNIDFSDDIIATINGMRAMGAIIEEYRDYVVVQGINSENLNIDIRNIDCNESGSTLRFLVPISTLVNGKKRFIGRGNLGKRPLDTYYRIFERDGIEYSYKKDELDLVIEGNLKGGDYYLEGNISSQFITGLLFTLPLIENDSRLIITTDMESKGYIDLTLAAMKDFGIEIINNDYREFIIKGNQRYKARNYKVEGDFSQAAFFLVANAIGSDVHIDDILIDSAQGDKEVVDILKRMGLEVDIANNRISKVHCEKLTSTVIDASQCPDIIPVVSVAAALAEGTTVIKNGGRLRIKECDRLMAVATELNKLGADVIEEEDGLVIHGVPYFKGGCELWSWNDHRIAMTLAIAATRCKEPVTLRDYQCISKSYPAFFDDYRSLGGVANEWKLGK